MIHSRRVACLTMMRDEDFFFQIWYRYYAALFGQQNLFVIDHMSKERPTAPDGLGRLNVLTLPFERALDAARRPLKLDGPRFRLISSFIAGLLEYYDTVIFNDTDEIFVVDPAAYRDLRDFLESPAAQAPVLAGMGLDIIHDPRSEPALDPARPVMEQRRNFVYAPVWTKPHIVNTPCRIAPHGVSVPFRYDPDLYLIHLKHCDVAYTLRRQADRHDMYNDDAVSDFCTWKLTPEQKNMELVALLERPLVRDELPHQAKIAHAFGGKAEKLLGSEDGPPRRRPTKLMTWAYKFHEFLPGQVTKDLNSGRHILPPRFGTPSGI